MAKFSTIVVFVAILFTLTMNVSASKKFYTIWDICDYVCEKNCLYLGGVVGGACTYGRCACRVMPSVKPFPKLKPKKVIVGRDYFHFVINLPSKWFKKSKNPSAGYNYYPVKHPYNRVN